MAKKTRVRRREPTEAAPPADAPEAQGDAQEAAPAPKTAAPPKQNSRRRSVHHPTTAPEAPARAEGPPPTPAGLAELEAIASMDDFDMDALLGGPAAPSAMPEPGEKLQGTVVSRSGDGLHLDLGARAAGWISSREVPDAQVGDTVEAFVVSADDTGIVLSKQLSGEAAARHLEEAAEHGLPIEGKVESKHGGGYRVRIGPLRAFCPISQIDRLPLADPESVVGTTLAFLVVEGGDDVVLSRRKLQEQDLDAMRAKRWATLEEGQVVDAVVTSVQGWGAFLDVEGVDMRLPNREISWDAVDDATTRLERGQRIRVRVTDIRDGRVTASLKDPALDPWNTASTQFPPGSVTSGKVVSKTEFGVFVEIGSGLQGLVHRSRIGQLPSQGTTLDVRVLGIDPERRRIELAPTDFDPDKQAANSVGTEVKAEVIEVQDRGVVVRLEDGRQAYLPQGEVELDPGTVLAQRFRAGREITVRVLSDDARRRVTVTMKAPEADDWRSSMPSGGGSSMGTLGDLLGGWKKS